MLREWMSHEDYRKRLEIDLVEIDVGLKVLEYLGRRVAVGDETAGNAHLAHTFENFDGPLSCNQRLIVGADADGRPMLDRQFRELIQRRQ